MNSCVYSLRITMGYVQWYDCFGANEDILKDMGEIDNFILTRKHYI